MTTLLEGLWIGSSVFARPTRMSNKQNVCRVRYISQWAALARKLTRRPETFSIPAATGFSQKGTAAEVIQPLQVEASGRQQPDKNTSDET